MNTNPTDDSGEEQYGGGDGTMEFATLSAAPINPSVTPLGHYAIAETGSLPAVPNTWVQPFDSGWFGQISELPLGMGGGEAMDLGFESDGTTTVSLNSSSTNQSSRITPSDESSSHTFHLSSNPSHQSTESEPPTPLEQKNAPKRRQRQQRTEVEKKEQIKQRNRVAASKCRQRKKEKVHELEEIKTSLELQNSHLHLEYQRLRDEIGRVKNHLINHTSCNDPNIDRWVQTEASGYIQRLVQREEDRRSSVGSNLDGALGHHQIDNDHHISTFSSPGDPT